ncbi:MAG: hypothetical protein ACLFVB_10545 [Thermoplasmata archaeon]
MGATYAGDTSNSYWDMETSKQDNSDTGVGLKTEDMVGSQAEESLGGFDFDDIWETVEADDPDAIKDGYPILRSINREKQLRAQGIYEDDEIMDEIPIPGFTSLLLVVASIIAIAIYRKKKEIA